MVAGVGLPVVWCGLPVLVQLRGNGLVKDGRYEGRGCTRDV